MTGHDPIPIADEVATLKARIAALESELSSYRTPPPSSSPPPPTPPTSFTPAPTTLTPAEYIRYSRQLLLSDVGLPGQLLLKSSRLLIIGLGGLGCPAATYLAAAGIGHLTLLDPDTVEASNLHRQPLHSTSRIGQPKVLSAATALQDLNPHITITPLHAALTPENAVGLVEGYDLVLDCTDRPFTRYLVSDACVAAGKPLVTASALKTDGQLTLLNSPPGVGPCYRCIWPTPPPADSVGTCGDSGVLGPVVGVMGVLQAVEALRVLLRPGGEGGPGMVLFSGLATPQWRRVRMRGRRGRCLCASPEEARGRVEAGGYVEFCGVSEAERVPEEWRVDVGWVRERRGGTVVVDVRDETQFGICHLPGSKSIPFEKFLRAEAGGGELPGEVEEAVGEAESAGKTLVVVCRLGNDSQAAVRRVRERVGGRVEVVDVRGGIREWARVAPEDGVVVY